MLDNMNGSQTGSENHTALEESAGQIQIPNGVDLQSAVFVRDGSDLLIQTDANESYVAPGYFNQGTLADFALPNGQTLSGSAFEGSSDINAQHQFAQVDIPGLEVGQAQIGVQEVGAPIGTVDNVEGAVSVTHVDGTTEFLNIGDKVYQGDVLETETGAGVGITLADTSVFSLGEEGQLVLDELVYDPGTQDGSAVISLVEGTASFVSGQIAKINPDAVSITTPVATIGIRGTKVFVEYKDGEFKAVNMIETTLDGEQPGEIVIFDMDGTPIGSTNQANIGWSWNPTSGGSPTQQQFTNAQLDNITRDAVRNLPQNLVEKAVEARQMEQMLKESADIAREEAANAKEEAQRAEEEAALAKEQALLAQEEAEKLLAMAAKQDSLMQDALEAKAQAELEMQLALEAEQRALEALAEAERAAEAERLAREAARDAHQFSVAAVQTAVEYTGYGVNGGNQQQGETGNSGYIHTPVENNSGSTTSSTTTTSTDFGTPAETSQFTGQGEDDKGLTPGADNDDNGDGGPTTDNGGSTSVTVTLNGTAVDGYIKGAKVFIDLNKNGKLDADEYTDANSNGVVDDEDYDASAGLYKTEDTPSSFGTFELSTDATDYVITLTGGIDIATGKEFYGVLQAPAGSTVITPLTTVLVAMMEEEGSTLTLEQAQAKLAKALGFEDLDLLDITQMDPIAGATGNFSAELGIADDDKATYTTALSKVTALGVQLQNTVMQAANVFEAATGERGENEASSNIFSNTIFASIGKSIAALDSEETFALNNADNIVNVISDAATTLSNQKSLVNDDNTPLFQNKDGGALFNDSFITKINDTASETANIIKASNQIITDMVDNTETFSLEALAQVAVVAEAASNQLNQISSFDNDAFSGLKTTYVDGINDALANAEIGDINGDGTVSLKPVSLQGTEDTVLTIREQDLIANHNFGDGGEIAIANFKTSNAGNLEKVDGVWQFTPADNSSATVNFTYDLVWTNGDQSETVSTKAIARFTATPDSTLVNDSLTTDQNQAITMSLSDLLDNDTIAQGGTITAVSNAQNGTVSLDSEAQTITFTPTDGYSGNGASFTYTVTENDGATSSATVSINVDADSSPSNDSVTLDEDSNGTTISILANDTLLEGATVSAITQPSHGQAVLNENGTVTYKSADNYNGSDSFTYTITDSDNETHTATVNLTVNSVNDAPTLARFSLDGGTEYSSYTLSASDILNNASDVDGDDLSISSVSITDETVTIVDHENGTWTITSSEEGLKTINFVVSDGTTTTTGSTTIDFADVNNTLTDDSATVDEDGETTITVLTNDSIVDGGSITAITQPSHGVAVLHDNGTITYTPTGDYNGPDSFTYTVTDEDNETQTATVDLTINAVNDAPVADDTVSLSTAEDTSLTITLADLLGSSSDVDQDSLTIENLSIQSGNGTLTPIVSNDVTTGWTYEPAADDDSQVVLAYDVSDGTTSDSTTATLDITSVNDAPVVNTVSLDDGTEGVSYTVTNAQLIANSTDVDGDTLDVTAISGSNIAASENDDGSWTLTSTEEGEQTITFTVSDGTTTTTQTATINFADVDNSLTSDSASLDEGGSTTITVLANDSIVDGGSVTAITQPDNGVAVLNDDGSITYTPTSNYSGADSFTYTVTDEDNETQTAKVNLTVNATNTAPTVGTVTLDGGTEGVTYSLTDSQLLANSSDADGDSLSVTSISGDNLIVINTGNGNWSLTSSEEGTKTITFTVSDGTTTTTQTATIDFADVDNSLANDTASVTEDGSVSVAVLENDTIRDGGTITAVSSDNQNGGSVRIDGNNVVYTAASDYSGEDTFSYTVTDDSGDTQTASVTMTVIADADSANLNLSIGAASEVSGETVTITRHNVTETGNGYTVTGQPQSGHTPDAASLTSYINEEQTAEGFGVSGDQSGQREEIGYRNFAETIYIDFDNSLDSVDVAFSWLNQQEAVYYEFFLNGTSQGSGTYTGTNDKIEPTTSLSPSNDASFDQIIFKPSSTESDFLINSVSFEQSETYVDLPISLSATEGDADGSETLSSIITLSGIPDTATLYVDNESVTVTNGSVDLANNNLDNIKIRVTDDQDNFDLTATITSTDGNDTQTTTTTVNVPDYTFGANGDDIVAIQSGNVTVNGGSGSDTLQLEAGFDPDFVNDNISLSSVETIDMLTDTAANSLTLSASHITSFNDNASVVITGDNSDTLTLSEGSDWQQGDTADGYTTYSYNQNDTTAQVQVSQSVNVTGF